MKLIPRNDYLLVIPDEQEIETPGGVFLPPVARTLPEEGLVRLVGPEAKETKPGDRVLFEKHGSQVELRVGVEVQILVSESSSVLAVIG
jgi:co-chaperonin GroES (HSP10)